MKFTLILVVSLALNFVGACLILLGRNQTPPTSPGIAASTPAQPEAPSLTAEVWPALETAELPTLIERLKASGFPPDIVRAIAAAQIGELFAARRRELQSMSGDRPYWKDGMPDPKMLAAQRELAREQQKMMRELFGEAAEGADGMRDFSQNRSLAFLPAEKASEVRRIIREVETRRADYFASGAAMIDRDKIASFEKEQQAMIAQVLTPEEMKEYDVRNSTTASTLREQLAAFNPTEEEFRTIFALRRSFDERFGSNFSPTMSSAEQRARMDAERALTEQIKATLSAPRAAEYDRGTDSNYRRTTQLINRLELPPETATTLWTVQKEFEQRRNELYQRGVPAGEERTQALAALQRDAIARVTPLLGSTQNVEVYKQYGGQWIDSMIPRPRPAPPAKQ